MVTFRVNEDDLVRDLLTILAKVREGIEVVVESDHIPIAVITPAQGPGRPIGECIAQAKAFEEKLGYRPTPDADFARDVQDFIDARREPLKTPEWD